MLGYIYICCAFQEAILLSVFSLMYAYLKKGERQRERERERGRIYKKILKM
jgi:hypothetical protein